MANKNAPARRRAAAPPPPPAAPARRPTPLPSPRTTGTADPTNNPTPTNTDPEATKPPLPHLPHPDERPVTATPTHPAPPETSKVSMPDPGAVVEQTSGEAINLENSAGAANVRVPVDEDDVVTAIVPAKFTLTRDGGEEIKYEAGIVEMPRADAAHWWARAQGVKEYDPKKKATKED